jgi:phenylpropionate dioxygenase-like ring-hydroxylating dioxygenase large terminal subunit
MERPFGGPPGSAALRMGGMAVHPPPPPPTSAFAPGPGPAARGYHSVVTLADQWFVACASRTLRGRPLAATVQGVPLVLFRDASGRAGALEDRCPHRNAPLTAGRVRDGELQCAYHGWRFDVRGACLAVPGLASPPEARATRATAFACDEADGFVWVYSTPGVEPRRAPPRFPHVDDPGYSTVRRSYEVRSTMLAALENVLDVPHTAYLHGGLFRTSHKEREIDVVIRRYGDRAEAEFLGEPRPKGLAARLLAPGGGVVTHVDRFLLPSLAQVEYRLGGASHLVVTTAMTPLDAFRTRLHSVVTFRLPLPGWLVAPLVAPVAAQIFRQDARMLRLLTDNVERFGGERFATTEIDVLGPQIWRLLKQAERGEDRPSGDLPEHEHRVRMRL